MAPAGRRGVVSAVNDRFRLNDKTRGRRFLSSLDWFCDETGLEIELHAQPHAERSAVGGRIFEVRVQLPGRALDELVDRPDLAVVGYVEEIGHEAHLRPLTDLPRIIEVEIELSEAGRAAQHATSAERNLTGVQIDRVRKELADRNAGLHVDAETGVQPAEALEVFLTTAKDVVAEDVDDVMTIRVERPDLELIAEQ